MKISDDDFVRDPIGSFRQPAASSKLMIVCWVKYKINQNSWMKTSPKLFGRHMANFELMNWKAADQFN